MADQWLLIETFGGDCGPSVIGVGTTPKRMVPLRSLLSRGRSLAAVEEAITSAMATSMPDDHPTRDGQHRVVSEPLISFRGHVHGVWVWVGGLEQDPPPRDLAGAWHFNLSTDTIGGSDGLLDLYGVPQHLRQTERATAEAFTRLVPNVDDAQAMALPLALERARVVAARLLALGVPSNAIRINAEAQGRGASARIMR